MLPRQITENLVIDSQINEHVYTGLQGKLTGSLGDHQRLPKPGKYFHNDRTNIGYASLSKTPTFNNEEEALNSLCNAWAGYHTLWVREGSGWVNINGATLATSKPLRQAFLQKIQERTEITRMVVDYSNRDASLMFGSDASRFEFIRHNDKVVLATADMGYQSFSELKPQDKKLGNFRYVKAVWKAS